MLSRLSLDLQEENDISLFAVLDYGGFVKDSTQAKTLASKGQIKLDGEKVLRDVPLERGEYRVNVKRNTNILLSIT